MTVEKKRGGRPTKYDDSDLLLLIAEHLAWPEYKIAVTQDDAIRKTIDLIPGSRKWEPERHARLVQRLKKAYSNKGKELEATLRRQRRRFSRPYLPPSLLSTPEDPELVHERREAILLEEGLRHVAEWTVELRDVLLEQLGNGRVNSDLLTHARRLVALVKTEEERAEREQKKNSPS